MVKKTILAPPCLQDLQFYTVRFMLFLKPPVLILLLIFSWRSSFCKVALHLSLVGQWLGLAFDWLRMWERIDGKCIAQSHPLRMNYGSGRSGKSLRHSCLSTGLNFYRALVCIDRAVSAALGRPCAIQDEE